MAHFRAVIEGNRGPASRLGSKSSGIVARINGWHSGVIVEATYDTVTGRDVFFVRATGGSSGGDPDIYVVDDTFIVKEESR
jgi:hypothetical protein